MPNYLKVAGNSSQKGKILNSYHTKLGISCISSLCSFFCWSAWSALPKNWSLFRLRLRTQLNRNQCWFWSFLAAWLPLFSSPFYFHWFYAGETKLGKISSPFAEQCIILRTRIIRSPYRPCQTWKLYSKPWLVRWWENPCRGTHSEVAERPESCFIMTLNPEGERRKSLCMSMQIYEEQRYYCKYSHQTVFLTLFKSCNVFEEWVARLVNTRRSQ